MPASVRTHRAGQEQPKEQFVSHDITPLVTPGDDGEPTTTSLVIAEGTGNHHQSVRELIEDNRADFEEFGVLRFETGKPSAQGGRPTRYAVVNEAQATLLMTYLRNSEVVRAFKKRLVHAFMELRSRRSQAPALQGPELIAAAFLESQKVLEQREVRIHQLEQKATADAPKVAYVDTFVADEDCVKRRVVAASLGVQEKWLTELLIEKKWIYAEQTTRYSQSKGVKETVTRYSAYADKKRYFRPIPVHEAPRFRGEVMHTLKVTPQGAEAIARLVAQEAAA
ncbi:antirepressor [Gordonia phage Cashline]|nr:antirepressor [Gordonia phage Cashline]